MDGPHYNASDWAVGTTFAPLAAGSYDTSPNPTTWLTTDNVSLGASTVEVGNGTNINSLKLTGSATITLDGNLTLTSGGLLITGSAAPTITGAGTLLGGSGADLIVQQYSSGNLTIASALADNGTATSLTKSGPGKLIITGANTMTGANYFNGGVVEVSSMSELASGPIIMTSGTLRYTGAGVTDLRTIMLNGLGGTFDVSSSSTTLTVSNLSNSDGIQIVNATAGRLMGNLGGLTKIGAGTLALTGSNYINGFTVVSNGTLLVNGTNTYDTTTFNAGNVTVFGGTLGGTGMISGPVTVMTGGTIAPGDDPGTLTLATNLTMGTGTTALFEMANSPGVSDMLVVQGNLTIGSGSTIAISVPGTPLAAGTYKLIKYSGTKSGSFNSLPVVVNGTINGSYAISDSITGEIDLVVNNQVVIISEPSDTNTVPGATLLSRRFCGWNCACCLPVVLYRHQLYQHQFVGRRNQRFLFGCHQSSIRFWLLLCDRHQQLQLGHKLGCLCPYRANATRPFRADRPNGYHRPNRHADRDQDKRCANTRLPVVFWQRVTGDTVDG